MDLDAHEKRITRALFIPHPKDKRNDYIFQNHSQPQQVVPQDHEKESNVQLVFKTDPDQTIITHVLKDNAIILSKT